MRNRSTLVIIVLSTTFLIPLVQSNTHGTVENTLELTDSGQYHLGIIAYQFNYTFIDLAKYNSMLEDGITEINAYVSSTFNSTMINNLDYGRVITIEAKSAQGIHGLFIKELSIELELLAPGVSEKFGPTVTESVPLPAVDTTINVYCNIFCGAGHSEMNFQIIVGEGRVIEEQEINILGDWRVLVLFGLFLGATMFVVLISVMKPIGFLRGENSG